MDDTLIWFGKRYFRFLRLLELVVVYVPEWLQWPLARLVSRFCNPYNGAAVEIKTSLANALSLDAQAVQHAWLRWRASHTRFVLTFFRYDKIDSEWIQRHVQVANPELLKQIVQVGGLILTYHTHHQNTLATVLGAAGSTISPVAASGSDSPLYHVIGRYIDLINKGSQQKFRGGAYLYTDNLRRILQEARTRLQRGELLLSLCDFHTPSSEQPHCFLGRTITPPTGVIRLALQCEVPIYYGLLFPDQTGKFQLMLAHAKGRDLRHVTEEYLAFLAQAVRYAPEAWQGWEWYSRLPDALPVVENLAS